MNRNSRAAMAVGLSLLALPAPVAARDTTVVEGRVASVRVSYADLDLATPAGLDALDGRMRRAAKKLCRDTGMSDILPVQRACTHNALYDARPQVERARQAFAANEQVTARSVRIALRK